jgi:hypothetical protein
LAMDNSERTAKGQARSATLAQRKQRKDRSSERTGTLSHSGSRMMLARPVAMGTEMTDRNDRHFQDRNDRHFQPLWPADDAGSTGRDGDF